MFGAYAAGFLASVNQTITATALPRIVRELGGLDLYPWVFTGYILALVVAIPLFGKLSDVYGRRRVFAVAIFLFSVGSSLCAAAPSIQFLIGGRLLQGFGAGGLGPLSLAVLGDIISPRARGKWQAVGGTVTASAAVFGPLLGGFIADNGSWRLAFVVSLPVAAISLGIIWFGFGRRGVRQSRALDYPGAILFIAATASGLFAVSTGGVQHPWGSPAILAPLAGSLVLLAAFVVWERRAREPILPFRLLRSRAVASSNVCLFAIGAANLGAITFVPLFMEEVLGRTATSAGAVLLPLTLSWTVAGIVGGQIVSRTGRPRPLLLLGPPLAAFGFLLLATMGTGTSDAAAIRDVLFVGGGLGLMAQTLVVIVQDTTAGTQRGAATAFCEFSRWLGALIGVAAMGGVVSAAVGSARMHGASASVLAPALRGAFAIGIALSALALCAILALPDGVLSNSVLSD